MAKFTDVLKRALKFSDADYAPLLTPSAVRVNATAGAASTAEAALPTGSKGLRISATEPCYIRFGNAGMDAAAANATSMLFLAGTEYMGTPVDVNGVPYDYFRAIRAGGSDSTVQFEAID